MCSQFEIKANLAQIAAISNSQYNPLHEPYKKSHIYPFDNAPVIKKNESGNLLGFMSYSLIPAWSDTSKPKFSTYNARLDRMTNNQSIEYIYNVPTWRNSFHNRRCIVPLTGFFESCQTGSHAGSIVKFSEEKEQILFAAGLWDAWTNKESGEIIHSFAIITDDPKPFFLEVGHDRQPVFLDLDKANQWLDKGLKAQNAYDFLKNSQSKHSYKVETVRVLKNYKSLTSSGDLFNQ